MARGSILVATLLIALSALMTVSLAQESDQPCSSRDTVYPTRKVAILDDATYQGVRVRYAAAGERLDIIGSRRFGPWCWLQVSDGWLIDSASALRSAPRATVTESGSATGAVCYQAERAYVIGNMNIRELPSTTSRVVAKAQAASSFAVAASIRGDKWCWLNITQGWLAHTAHVQATEPLRTLRTTAATSASTETQQTQPNIDNCCFVNLNCQSEQDWVDGFWAFRRQECSVQGASEQISTPAAPHYIINSQGRRIPIYGDEEFRLTIARGFFYLRDRLPRWWQYVAIIDDVKYGGKEGNCNYACANWPYKNVRFGPIAYGQSASTIAQTLIHESCHLYQWQEGRGENYDWSVPRAERSHEIECENVERAAGF